LIKTLKETKENQKHEDCCIFVLDCPSLFNELTISTNDFDWLLRNASTLNVTFIFVGNVAAMERSYNHYAKTLKTHIPVALIGTRLVDQQIIRTKTSLREAFLEKDEMIYVDRNKKTKIKLPTLEINGK
jgi:S-DNA-T family DNA segregation ATPase FtsK/SpoIIIE